MQLARAGGTTAGGEGVPGPRSTSNPPLRESQANKPQRTTRKELFHPIFLENHPSEQPLGIGGGGGYVFWGDTLDHRGQPRAGKFWRRRPHRAAASD